MYQISLEAYSVSLRYRNKRNSQLTFEKFDGTNNLWDVIANILRAYKVYRDVPVLQKCICIDSLIKYDHRVRGLVRIGDYGFRTQIVNASTQSKSYDMTEKDAMLHPFFFDFHFPENSQKGILLIQRTGVSGIKGLLESIIDADFKKLYQEYIIDIRPLMPAQAAKKLISSGKISKVRFVQHKIPSDIADRFNGDQKPQEGDLEIVLRPQRKGILRNIPLMEILDGKRGIQELIEMENFEPDNIKVEIDIEGKRRIIDFGNLGRLKAAFDITDDVAFGDDGFPTFISMSDASKSLLVDLSDKIGT